MAIALPLAWDEAGLSIASHRVAGYGREDILLRLARQLEASRPWHRRYPSVHG